MPRQTLFALAAVSLMMGAIAARESLDPVAVNLVEAADSGSYFLYTYEVVNPTSSSSASATFSIDVGASSGTPTALAATGTFHDLTTLSASQPLEPYARVGPISPGSWRAVLQRDGVLAWLSPALGPVSTDSVAPGDTLSGVGIRSDFLPGLSTVVAEPTWQSCCSVVDTLTGQNPRARDFSVSSTTVAPRFMAEEVDIDLLQSQLATVCTDPLWLDDSQLCTEFSDLLDLAEDEEDDANFYGAAAVLGRLEDRVTEEQASMDGNAYWLLSLNAAQAESNALDTAAVVADRWHFDTTMHGVLGGSWTLASTPQDSGAISGSISPAHSATLNLVKTVQSSGAFADGAWSVQLDFFDVTANGTGLTVYDVEVSRYTVAGTLLESRYLLQGQVATLPAGDTRVSVTGTLTGWSSGHSDDRLALRFRIENPDQTSSDSYSIRAGVDEGDWGASWLSQPK